MFGMSNFKSSNSRDKVNELESLVRNAMQVGELSPGAAVQIERYRAGKPSCEERRMLAILDDAIVDGCVTPIELSRMKSRRQVVYSVN